jgi:hypothetical protein
MITISTTFCRPKNHFCNSQTPEDDAFQSFYNPIVSDTKLIHNGTCKYDCASSLGDVHAMLAVNSID